MKEKHFIQIDGTEKTALIHANSYADALLMADALADNDWQEIGRLERERIADLVYYW